MKKWIRFEFSMLLFAVAVSFLFSCKQRAHLSKDLALHTEMPIEIAKPTSEKQLSEDFKKYWYAGEAEITSYKLEQARYGELREGEAVLIYVTEPFLPNIQVKADGNNPDNVPVLKLNATKNYLTGIYPYSIMSSTFYPVNDDRHAIKTSFSAQEWCGHVYSQINNRDDFEFTSHSYFEGEADQNLTLDKAILEGELWAKIRINPEGLPVGNITLIPSLEFIRLKHKEVKAYAATATITKSGANQVYSIEYPQLNRTLKIEFSSEFPHSIEGWTEEFKSGFGPRAKVLKSSATKIKQLKTPYWRQNSNQYIALRDTLGL